MLRILVLKALLLGLLAVSIAGCSGGGGGGGGTSTGSAVVSLQGVTVTPANATLALGTTLQFVATGTFSDGTVADVSSQATWAVQAGTGAATVTDEGLVQGTSVGTATVSATLSGLTGARELTVTAANLTGLAITPGAPSIAKGTTQQFVATGTFSDGSTQDLTSAVTWSASSGTGSASISNAAGSQGLATGTGVGSVTISAAVTLAGVPVASDPVNLTVTAATLSSLAVTPGSAAVALGTAQTCTATGTFSDGTSQDLTAQATWSVTPGTGSAGNVANVVTGTGIGSVTVTATMGGVSGSASLQVTAATLQSLAIAASPLSVAKGTSTQFTATGSFSDGTTQDLTSQVTWTATSLTGAAVISNAAGSQGLATGTAEGTVGISATFQTVTSNTATLTVTAASLAALEVTPGSPSLAKGTTQQLTATGTFTDGSAQDLTTQVSWTSSAGGVATVDGSGLVGGVGVGQATVTATSGAISGSTTVTVTNASLVSLQITPGSPSLAAGTTVQLAAQGLYSDNSTQDLTTLVTWSSDNTGAATVSNAGGSQGLATAVAQGAANVSATLGAVSTSTQVTVTAATLVSLAITPDTPAVALGTAQGLTLTATWSDGSVQDVTTQASWTSSEPATATVDAAGNATSVATGQTTITGAFGGLDDTTVLTVTDATLVSLVVSPPNALKPPGSTLSLTATGTFTDGSTQDLTRQVTWSTSDSTVASVSNLGGSQGLMRVQGADEDTATLTATLDGVSGTSSLTVGRYVFTSNASNETISSLKVDGTTGELTLVSTVSTSDAPAQLAVDPSGRYLYAMQFHGSQAIRFYTIDPSSGGLSFQSTSTVNSYPGGVVVHPSGKYLYAANVSGLLYVYVLDPTTGAPPAVPDFEHDLGGALLSLDIDATGRFLYVADSGFDQVTTWSVDPTTGDVTQVGGAVATGADPTSIAVEPSGRFVYTANLTDGTVSAFSANGSTGALTSLGAVSSGAGTWAVASDPFGRFLFAANWTASTLAAFLIDSVTGALTSAGSTALSIVQCVTVDPSGDFVYAGTSGAGVRVYSLDGTTGALTEVSGSPFTTGGHNLQDVTVNR